MTLQEFISYAVKGNAEAAQFLCAIHQAVDLWDDVIDKDKPYSDAMVNQAFHNALIVIPRNEFYRRNFAALNSLLESAILDWHTANALEKTKTEPALREAYVLRCSVQTLTIKSAQIMGGDEWARQISFEIRSMPSEWAAYAAKHGVEQ